MVESPFSLYFHIPFCTKKCDYCHFFVLPNKDPLKADLLRGLKMEWDQNKHHFKNKHIVSIYFGGGTPSLIGPKAISEILNWIQQDLSIRLNEIEVTLEVNPEDVTYSLIDEYRQVGINRMSLGIQTFSDPLLIQLGRIHTSNKSLGAIETVFSAGINNISIDLMYDLPGQTLKDWEDTLSYIHKLPITHLSLYNLTIEPHTGFFKRKQIIESLLPPPEISLKMYTLAQEALLKAGLEQYEISAFSKPGYASKHNTGYWIGRPFWGFGPSAFSYFEGKRFKNVSHLGKYVKALEVGTSPIDFEEQLDPEAALRELFLVKIRLLEGVPLQEFDALDKVAKKEALALTKQGYLSMDTHQIRLTEKGILFYDTVAAEIV